MTNLEWETLIDEILHFAEGQKVDAGEETRMMAEALRQAADRLEGFPLGAIYARQRLEGDLKRFAADPTNPFYLSSILRLAERRYSMPPTGASVVGFPTPNSPSDAAGGSETRNSPPPAPKAP